MMNADATAENRPACLHVNLEVKCDLIGLTNIKVVLRSSWYFLWKSLSYSSASWLNTL